MFIRPSCKIIAMAVSIILLLTLLSGCSQNNEKIAKQQLVVGLSDDLCAKWWKKIYAGVSPYKTQIYEPLVYADHNLKTKPCLATSWERLSENTWRFYLRKGVKFHDGTTFTAQNVKFSFERLLELRPGTDTWLHIDQNSVKIIDDYTVEIMTTNPCAEYPGIIAHPMVAMMGFQVKEGIPCGTGPFKVEEASPENEVILTKNEDYWGQKAKLEKITFRYIPDHNTRVMALLSGEVDAIFPVPPASVTELEKNANYKVDKVVGPRVDFLRFNSEGKKPYDKLIDLKIRKAIAFATNKDIIVEHVLNGIGLPANTTIAPMITWSANDELKGYPYNLDKAKELLDEAGWKDTDGNGILDKNSEPLKINLIISNRIPYHATIGEVLQSQLRKVGIDLELQVVESGAKRELIKTGKYDMVLENIGTKSAAADYLLWEQYHSMSVQKRGWAHLNMNLSPEVSKKLDELLDTGLSSMKPKEERYKAWKEAQKIFFDEEVIDLPLLFQVHVTGLKKEVQGFKPHSIKDWLEWHNVYIK